MLAFETTGRVFQDWLRVQRKRGVERLYFVLRHSSVPTLESELGQPSDVVHLTTMEDNNKFLIVVATIR